MRDSTQRPPRAKRTIASLVEELYARGPQPSSPTYQCRVASGVTHSGPWGGLIGQTSRKAALQK
eukprot:scaffold187933_cov29-Tisochrysis_lutea.AAC.3